MKSVTDLTPAALSQKITDLVVRRTEVIIARFVPDFVIPGFFCGHRGRGVEGPDLIFLLGHLHSLGVSRIGGVPVEKAITKLLRAVDGPATETFYSYRVAETLLAFGKFQDNPLLADFSAAERENVRVATDSTCIYDPETKSLRRFLANNFWVVLARCEFARQRLGILEDDGILKHAVAQLGKVLFRNPAGFFDDSPEEFGRYDIYSTDAHLFSEPLWHLLDGEKLEVNLLRHVRLLEKTAMENGAFIVYGRSIGVLSICHGMELASVSVERGLASDPTRTLKLIAHALNAFDGWFEDDLLNAHRHGNTEGYRGIYRVMQMAFDCMGKLCYAAEKLLGAPAIAPQGDEITLFPHIDEFIPFDSRNAGLWMFRNDHFSFQFPLVGGGNADYMPWPRSPGLLENPVDSPMLCGVPRIANGGLEYSSGGLPAKVEKSPGGIVITHESFQCMSDFKGAPLGGRRTAAYRVEGDTIRCDEHLVFDQAPDALSYFIPETARPLRVAVTSAQPFHQDTVAVSGMAEWRSSWGGFENVHQIHFQPANDIRFSYEITPKLRVRTVPKTNHDYMSSLFAPMPRDYFIEKAWSQDIGMNVEAMASDVDIIHVSWPEHLFGSPSAQEMEDFDARNHRFIEELGRKGVRIVWTMHNRRPHRWDEKRGHRLYEAWAAIADGVIHHSEWGMQLIRAELPFRADARHIVIPHGHFGAQRRPTRTRPEIERALGLPPCTMRFGITGGWGKDKQVEMIMAAFVKAAQPGQQLVITAHTPETVRPNDPRIFFIPRGTWLTTEEITDFTHICDALVTAHRVGGSYLTSGIPADAIGEGIPMFVPHWEYFHETLGDAPFYHDNTEDSLAAAFASITEEDLQRGKTAFRALQPGLEWPGLAAKTLAFYRSLGQKPVSLNW